MTLKRQALTEDLLNRNLPHHVLGRVTFEGLAIPLDKFMVGEARFVRRLGSIFPIMTPNNSMRLAKSVQQNDSTIYVTRLLPELAPGMLVSFNGKEIQRVSDTQYDLVNMESKVILARGILGTRYSAESTVVYAHAFPVSIINVVSIGAATVVVGTTSLLVHGDVLVDLADSDVPGSGVEYEVLGLTILTDDPLTHYRTYSLTLDRAVAYARSVTDTYYIRAYPAYRSIKIPLPTQPTEALLDNVGPFLWDVAEGRLHDGINHPKVTLAVETTSSAYLPLDTMAVTSKNTPYLRTPIRSDAFIFWTFEMGGVEVDSNRAVVVCDSNGDALLLKELSPEWYSPGFQWIAGFEADFDTELVIRWRVVTPLTAAQVVALPAGWEYEESHQVLILNIGTLVGGVSEFKVITTPPAPHVVTRVEVGFYCATAAARIKLREWSQQGSRASWVEYTLVAQANGDYTWASSGLLIKPVMLSLDDLRRTRRLDAGGILL